MSDNKNIWRRIGYVLSFLIVAGVAAYVSYGHLREVALRGHQPAVLAALLPLSMDGLMLIATLAMAEDKAANRHPRGWARFSFWLGAAISTAANITATAVQYGDPISIAVASVAPLALLLAIEIVARPGKPKAQPVAVEQTIAEPVEEPEVTMAELESPQLAEAPVSPATTRQYSERHDRRLRTGR